MSARDALRRLRARARARLGSPRRFGAHRADLLSFSPPSFLGVSRSTESLFPAWQGLDATDLATAARRDAWASSVAESGARMVILSGFDAGYDEAARRLRSRAPAVRIAAVWHGSTLQLADELERSHFEALLALAQDGVVDRIAFLKEGMDRLFEKPGLPCFRLMNWVDRIPEAASPVTDAAASGRVALGLWFAGSSWRKNPYAMLCAASLIPGAQVSGVFDRRAIDWCRERKLCTDRVSSEPLPPEALGAALARQHCNLYVTLSECSPLLPLESLAAGAPCIVAPNSDLFRDDPRLSDALVESRVDDPHAIAERVRKVVAEREDLVADYARYAVSYNARACELRDRFLEF